MAEHENIEQATVAPTVQTTPAPIATEKVGLLGQTPSMWFLIDTGIVFLIVLIMRLTA